MPRCGGGGDRVVCYERLVATTADEVNKRLADTMAVHAPEEWQKASEERPRCLC